MSWAYHSGVTFPTANVSADQTQFTALISFTDARFKSAANGGHVQSASGFDIYAYADAALTQRLAIERQSYDAVAGTYTGWVNVPTLSASVATTIYLAYGDASIVSDPNSDATYGAAKAWDSHCATVYHCEAASGAVQVDSTGNASAAATGSPTQVAGKVGKGFDTGAAGAGYYTTSANTFGEPLTISVWAKSTQADESFPSWVNDNNNNAVEFGAYFNGTAMQIYAASGVIFASAYPQAADGAWHSYAISCAGGTVSLYVDGVFQESAAHSMAPTTGLQFGHGASPFIGSIDEIRVSFTNRSASWLATEYKNQANPATFATLGSESSAGGGSTAYVLLASAGVYNISGAPASRGFGLSAAAGVFSITGQNATLTYNGAAQPNWWPCVWIPGRYQFPV